MGTNWRAMRAEDKICDLQMNLKMSKDCTEELREENKALLALIKEASNYLDTNRLTNIAHGSILHQKFKEVVCLLP